MKEGLKVIKIGSHILDNEERLAECLQYFASIIEKKILIHGGGDFASKLAEKLNIPLKKVDGRRITNYETLEVITMAYAGKINKNIVAKLQALKCNCMGITGADANTIEAVKRPVNEIDYGFVGNVKKVNFDAISNLLQNNITPVFCAITHDKQGQLLNTNADTIASEIAIAGAKKYEVELSFISEKRGVLRDVLNEASVISEITEENFIQLKKDNIVADGMIPKIENAFYSLQKGVSEIKIGNESIFNGKNVGFTKIIGSKK